MQTRRQPDQNKPNPWILNKPGAGPVEDQRGFTLADVAIATAIFSAVLVVCLGAFMSMGRIYFKGSVELKTQEVGRSVLDEIGRTIATTAVDVKYIPNDPVINPDEWEAYCIAGIKYSFRKGYQLERDPPPTAHKGVRRAFVKSVVSDIHGNFTGDCRNVTSPEPPLDASKGLELMDYRMRLQDFRIDKYGHLHVIKLQLIYGGNPDNPDFEKEVFEFPNEIDNTQPNYLDFQLDEVNPDNRTRCELGEAFCFILRLKREVYQSIVE